MKVISILLFVLFGSFSLIAQTAQAVTSSSYSNTSISRTSSGDHSNPDAKDCTYTFEQNVDIPVGKQAALHTVLLDFLGGKQKQAAWEFGNKKEGYEYEIKKGVITGRAWANSCDSEVEQKIMKLLNAIIVETGKK